MTHQVYLEKPVDIMSPMHTSLFACEKVRNLPKLFNCPTLKVTYITGQLGTTIATLHTTEEYTPQNKGPSKEAIQTVVSKF